MTSGKNRISAFGGLILCLLIAAGCVRPGTEDPLATPQGAQASTPGLAQVSPTPTAIAVVPNVSPLASPTPTGTPTPTQIPPAQPTHTPTATAPATSPQPGTTYTVKAGDRLFSIGRQFGVNPYSIAQANNILPPYIIRPGQVLKIPGSSGVTPVPGGKTHTVAPGENLFRISLRYGTTVQALAAANNITNVNLIFVGQVLKIP
jgi:LysM repeat protein